MCWPLFNLVKCHFSSSVEQESLKLEHLLRNTFPLHKADYFNVICCSLNNITSSPWSACAREGSFLDTWQKWHILSLTQSETKLNQWLGLRNFFRSRQRASYACFPAPGTGCTFSRPWHWMHVFPRLVPGLCFPIVSTSYITCFPAPWYRLLLDCKQSLSG